MVRSVFCVVTRVLRPNLNSLHSHVAPSQVAIIFSNNFSDWPRETSASQNVVGFEYLDNGRSYLNHYSFSFSRITSSATISRLSNLTLFDCVKSNSTSAQKKPMLPNACALSTTSVYFLLSSLLNRLPYNLPSENALCEESLSAFVPQSSLLLLTLSVTKPNTSANKQLLNFFLSRQYCEGKVLPRFSFATIFAP